MTTLEMEQKRLRVSGLLDLEGIPARIEVDEKNIVIVLWGETTIEVWQILDILKNIGWERGGAYVGIESHEEECRVSLYPH